MTSHRKQSAKQRADPDGPPSYNIRFDYSDIYLDNEDLEFELEGQESVLHKERLRTVVETEENLKIAKKEAEEMLQLKHAIKNRDPNESSNRISKSVVTVRKKSSKKMVNESPSIKTDENIKTGDDSTAVENGDKTLKQDTHGVNNLTMFFLSLKKFKSLKQPNTKDEKPERRASLQGDFQRKSTKSVGRLPKRPSTVNTTMCRTSDELLGRDKSTQYGIHVKKDHSRSRRVLEEISRLEQESKYGHVNKYEERRKRLLASCKDTKNIDERITSFLKNVDEFKKVSSAENSLEKVLMRSKSAGYRRNTSSFW